MSPSQRSCRFVVQVAGEQEIKVAVGQAKDYRVAVDRVRSRLAFEPRSIKVERLVPNSRAFRRVAEKLQPFDVSDPRWYRTQDLDLNPFVREEVERVVVAELESAKLYWATFLEGR